MRLAVAAILSVFLSCATFAQVTFDRIRNAEKEPANWLTYSGNLQGYRFSPLQEITLANVANLKVKWAAQLHDGGSETSPIVVGDIMYITGPQSAAALDTHTGRTLWTWKRDLPKDYHSIGFGHVNRGPAVLGDILYVTTLDCYLVALDLKSGNERWTARVADYTTGYSITGAPLAIDGKVIVGVSGGEAGIRGFLDAYDAKTGKQLWRFWTIPSPGEPGSDSWPGDSWVHGGGATWLTGSYDPALKLLYWGTGNPGPDWNGDSRKGDNLYTSSLVAIDVDSGKARWHFQFTPHDVHDWDANQTWAKGLDERGRPIEIPGMEPSEKGTLVYPSLQGSTNWSSPSYSPSTDMLYVPVREMGSIYYKTAVEYKPGTYYTGGSEKRLDEESWGAVRALDVKTGKQAWDFALPTPTWAGVMATAGGLVFSGSNEGNFFALDAKSGKPLGQFQTGGAIRSGPMSFLA